MKKSILVLGLAGSLIMFFTSCKDDLTNESFENGTAVIEGTAYANLDMTNDTAGVLYEYVPEGTNIYAVISSEDLVANPSTSVAYEDLIYTTEVGGSGSFTLTVAANAKAVGISFDADDFVASQIQSDETDELVIFYLPDSYTETVRDGMTKATDLFFSAE